MFSKMRSKRFYILIMVGDKRNRKYRFCENSKHGNEMRVVHQNGSLGGRTHFRYFSSFMIFLINLHEKKLPGYCVGICCLVLRPDPSVSLSLVFRLGFNLWDLNLLLNQFGYFFHFCNVLIDASVESSVGRKHLFIKFCLGSLFVHVFDCTPFICITHNRLSVGCSIGRFIGQCSAEGMTCGRTSQTEARRRSEHGGEEKGCCETHRDKGKTPEY
mmetsp:Transcript_48812/g.72532  ORF Transcript_48812/g.72532 Transcript_48812/m.72532 type:complete len:215 (-) Transcript_48812:30-674(-)